VSFPHPSLYNCIYIVSVHTRYDPSCQDHYAYTYLSHGLKLVSKKSCELTRETTKRISISEDFPSLPQILIATSAAPGVGQAIGSSAHQKPRVRSGVTLNFEVARVIVFVLEVMMSVLQTTIPLPARSSRSPCVAQREAREIPNRERSSLLPLKSTSPLIKKTPRAMNTRIKPSPSRSWKKISELEEEYRMFRE
jgi:hypothetical protein